MLDAAPSPRLHSRRESFNGLTAILVLCSVLLGALNPCALGNVQWLCTERTEPTEPNSEEASQVVLAPHHSARRGSRQELPRVSVLPLVSQSPCTRRGSVDNTRRTASLVPISLRLRC